MTPRKIFLFGLCIVAVIFIVSAIFPTDGIKIGSVTFRFPDYRTLLQPGGAEYKDIRSIIASVDTAERSMQPIAAPDTGFATGSADATIVTEPAAIAIDSVYTYTYPFAFPPERDTLLYPLFRIVNNLQRRDKPMRILHYGDSQIEGDRITATIRNYMQSKFGGAGIGFIPIVPATEASVTFQQDISPGWTRFSVLDKKSDSLARERRYGIAGSFARYVASGAADTVAHIGLKPFYIGYRNARSFTHARLFYGRAETPFTVVVNQTDTQRLPARDIVSSGWWRFAQKQTSLDLSLHSPALPDVYGIALDGARGVAVDNMAMRGSSGLDFTRMDTAQMGQMFRAMDAEMLILQFGANVVPNITDSYDYYARRLKQQLLTLKALKRGLKIVVIGVSDMSQSGSNGYVSYPNITKIRDAQKKAAFEADCVFWDLFEAMGGENSMPSWVFAEPPLAQKDFVHFTYGGAKIVAELFCRAWEKEYFEFAKRIRK